MPPMQPLSALIPEILKQAGLDAKVKEDECSLVLKDKPLDKTIPVRFANLPAGAKITLKTGHEPVLGVGSYSDAQPPRAVAAPPRPAAAPVAQSIHESENDGALPVASPQRAVAAPAPCADVAGPSSTPAAATVPSSSAAPAPKEPQLDHGEKLNFAGKHIHVFTREAEAEEDVKTLAAMAPDLDETAYEVTEADVRVQLAGYAARRADEGRLLMTRQMREAETARKAAAFGPVPVRVEMPDGVVVQASFAAAAPVAELRTLVEAVLIPEAANVFYLFTAPPKTELKDLEVSFYAAGLIPAARVHVGFKKSVKPAENGNLMRQEVMALCSSPPARAEALGKVSEGEKKESGSVPREGPKPAAGRGEGQEMKRAKGGVPSWMKLGSR